MKTFWTWVKTAASKSWHWLRKKYKSLPDRPRRILFGLLAAFVFLYYPVGMMLTHTIDDNINWRPEEVSVLPGGSQAIAAMAGLIDREVNDYGWVANDPFFKPSAALDNMPNFQMGMMGAFARFSLEMRDQIGRTRGTSTTDTDLEAAAGLLPYPGDVWIFNFRTSLLPTASSERQYNRARQALLAYNGRLAQGEAVFERRADNLLATLDRIALDVGASSAAIDDHVRRKAGAFLDFEGDDLFYTVKGQIYAYYMILRGLKPDFENIINARELGPAYDQMLASLRSLAEMDPLVVSNNEPDGLLFPNHLTAMGFYLLRARAQLRELTSILAN